MSYTQFQKNSTQRTDLEEKIIHEERQLQILSMEKIELVITITLLRINTVENRTRLHVINSEIRSTKEKLNKLHDEYNVH